jgi:phosphatidylinositol alpha-1,6-mannosyltransferase
MNLKILFITRNYPPKIGGLEAYSYNLINEFEKHDITYKIVLAKSKVHLIWFLPYCYFKAIYLTHKHTIRSIHLCDGFLAPVGMLLKLCTKARISISIHGLDITYRNLLYQSIVPWCIACLDMVICVSRATRYECLRRRIPNKKCIVIPNGIRPEEFYLPQNRDALRLRLEKFVTVALSNRKILVTVGRLVKRKGIAWFVDNVMPHLDKSYLYLIVGDGPEYDYIQEAVTRQNLQDRVILLGRVSDEERNLIYNASDIFIMPNIKVPGDVEGFGIVAIEAGSCGLPVVASNIQGIRDAVIEGKTGFLVKERDVDAFLNRINNMSLKKENIRSLVNSTFDWAKIYKRYLTVFL